MYPNVKYELQELEKLITLGEVKHLGSDQIEATTGKTAHEIDRIKQTFIYEVFHFEDERHLERYIQYHQQAIIRLMDLLSIHLQIDNTPNADLYHILHKGLDNLLSFVERHFTKYFDQDAKAPEGYLAIVRNEVKINSTRIQKGLTNLNADPKLVSLFLNALHKIAQSPSEKSITYRKIMYAKEIQKELLKLLDKEQQNEINEELRQLLYYLNFNSLKAITYHAHYISAILNETEIRAEKIERLSFVLKNVNQSQVKPGIGYNIHTPSLKGQINDYITVELEYQERLQRLSNPSHETPPDDLLSGFKLKIEASVAQLAYLLKLLIETKIIINSNLSHLLQFLARFVVTKKAENMSHGSLRSKFYNVENGTKESVRAILSTMIQHIDKS